MRYTSLLPVLVLLLVACSTLDGAEMPNFQDESTNVPTILAPSFDLEGHRGARGLKPENTLPAFETALDLQVTTLELDLHFTADGVVVVWHDPEIDNAKCRLDPDSTVDTPDPDSLIFQGANLRISNLTFEQVQAYICDRNPDPDKFPDQDHNPTQVAGDNYHIVSLAQLFDLVEAYIQDERKTETQRESARRVQFNVETKRNPDQPQNINDGFDGLNAGPFEKAILLLVESRGIVDRVIIQSFDHRSLWAIRTVNSEIQLAALTSRGNPKPTEYAAHGATIWSPNYKDITDELLAAAHEAGLQVIPWTVNDPEDMKALIKRGVDGIISDRPDLLAVAVGD